MSAGAHYQFGPFVLDTRAERLTRAGAPVALPPQPLQVLMLLVARAGTLVTREELRDAIWRERLVEFDQGINFAIRKIRFALEDDAEQPRYIETVPRRGYRFVAEVSVASAAISITDPAAVPPPPRRRRLVVALAGVAVLAAALVVAKGGGPTRTIMVLPATA